jgi:hypothetical protein
MTIPQIIKDVTAVLGTYSPATFHRDRRALKIKPFGVRQKPQQYPGDTAERIVKARGYEVALLPMRPLSPLDTAKARLDSMPELRHVRSKAKPAKRKATR